MLTKFQKQKIRGVIEEPVHGSEFYTAEMVRDLYLKIEEVLKGLHIDSKSTKKDIVDRINDYVMENVRLRKQYFDDYCEDELIYRTAYAALVKGEAVCTGFTEACRILVESCGIETHTFLSRLPEHDKDFLHYVAVLKYDCGSGRDYFVMDPERQGRCERKEIDAKQYLLDMVYAVPDQYFCDNKLANGGIGPKASEYMLFCQTVKGKNKVGELIPLAQMFKMQGKI